MLFVLRSSRLRAETHFAVQARNPLTLNQTGLVAITLTDYFHGSRLPAVRQVLPQTLNPVLYIIPKKDFQ